MTSSEPPVPHPVPPPQQYPPLQYPPPTSGVPYPYPVSAAPYGLAPQPVQPRWSPWIWVLTGLSALLFVGAAGMGYLYYDAKSTNDRQLTDRAAQIDELSATVTEMQDAGADLDDELANLDEEIADARARTEQLSPCPDAVAVFDRSTSEAEGRENFEAVIRECRVVILP